MRILNENKVDGCKEYILFPFYHQIFLLWELVQNVCMKKRNCCLWQELWTFIYITGKFEISTWDCDEKWRIEYFWMYHTWKQNTGNSHWNRICAMINSRNNLEKGAFAVTKVLRYKQGIIDHMKQVHLFMYNLWKKLFSKNQFANSYQQCWRW